MSQYATLNIAQRNIKSIIEQSQLSVNAWAKANGFTQTTINRYVTGQVDPPSSMLEKIAIAAKLQPWHMLLPDLNPAKPPTLRGITHDERELYEQLQQVLRGLAGLTIDDEDLK